MPVKKSPKKSRKRRERGRSLNVAFATQIQSLVFTPTIQSFIREATQGGTVYFSRSKLCTLFCEKYDCSLTPARFNDLLTQAGIVTTLHIGVGEPGTHDIPGQMTLPYRAPSSQLEPLPEGVRETTGTPSPTQTGDEPRLPMQRRLRPAAPMNALLTDPLSIPDPHFPGALA